MENIFIVAAVIAIIFLLTKFLEMRFVDKENKPITRSEETHVLDIYMYSTNTILIKISIKNDQYHLNYFN